MKILLTGAGGFIGSNLSLHLEPGHTVYKIKHKEALGDDGRTFYFDLTDVEAVKDGLDNFLFGKIEIDLIIHCAAILADNENHKSLDVFINNNKITESLILIAQKLNPKKVINFSTIGVYPNLDGIYTETSLVQPSLNAECLYSLSKFCSEELLNFYLKDISVINLRLCQTYGNGMRNDRIYTLFISELKETNRITVWGNGERTSNFISIQHLLSCIDRIIESNDIISGTYNVGEKNLTYFELAQIIVNEYGNKDSEVIRVDKGVKSKVLIDCSKLENILNDGF